jgi:hypothetical protein
MLTAGIQKSVVPSAEVCPLGAPRRSGGTSVEIPYNSGIARDPAYAVSTMPLLLINVSLRGTVPP